MVTATDNPIKSTFPSLEMTERVVLLIDVSRSMSQTDYPPTRLEAAKQAALAFIDKKLGIDEADEIALVAFAARGRTVCSMERVARHREQVQGRISRLKISYGGTKIASGLRRAASLLELQLGINADPKLKSKASNKGDPKRPVEYLRRIVLLSDGENLGGPDPLETANRLKRAGVVIDAIGIGERGEAPGPGWGLDEKTLQAIASPGRYKYIRDTASLMFHFEGLAEKASGDWAGAPRDAANGGVTETPVPSTSGGMRPAEVTITRPRRRRLWRLAARMSMAAVLGAVPAVVLGVFLLPAALESTERTWITVWPSAAATGLTVAWAARLSLRGSYVSAGVIMAVAAAAAAYAIGVYTHVGDVRASLDLAAEAPGLHGTVAGLAVAGGIAGAVRGPGQMLSVLGKGWWPWVWIIRRRYGFTTLKDGSPLVGKYCLNEKNEETKFRVGDAVVLCPVCQQPHHVDCWLWSDGHCYGGDTPCRGSRRVPHR
jgi:hypothetical protein